MESPQSKVDKYFYLNANYFAHSQILFSKGNHYHDSISQCYAFFFFYLFLIGE